MFALIRRFFSGNASVLVAVVVLFIVIVAYRDGYKQGQREGDTQIARLQQQRETERRSEAERQRTQLQQLHLRYQQQVSETHRLDAQYQQQLQQLETDNAKLQRNITSVTRRYIDAGGKSRAVDGVFTNGFVQQYNRAFGHGDNASSAATAGSTGTKASGVSAADSVLRDSGVSQRDVLAAATDAGHQCQRLAAQVNGLLDYIEMLQRQ